MRLGVFAAARRRSATGGGGTLHAENAAANAGLLNAGNNANGYYVGQWAYDPGANITVTSVKVRLTAVGTISGKTYTAEIWTLNGSDMGTLVQASAGQAGSNAWADTEVTFTFAGAALTNGTQYCIVITTNAAADASNYVRCAYTAAGGIGGFHGYFTSAGVRSAWGTEDVKLAIYKL